jgi:hypothetical protein
MVQMGSGIQTSGFSTKSLSKLSKPAEDVKPEVWILKSITVP